MDRFPEPPELRLIRAGRIAGDDDATGLLIRGDRIETVGDADRLEAAHPGAAVLDYGSACILPGFNDAHAHLAMMVANSMGVDLSPENTPGPERLEAALRSGRGDDQGWVRASRYDHMRTTGGTVLTRAQLDQWVPGRPAVVGHIGAHWGVVNSQALAAAGITEASPDPAGGSYGRDADGTLSGRVDEQAYFDFAYPALTTKPSLPPRFDGPEVLTALDAAMTTLLAAGITSVTDAMTGPHELRLLQRARSAGALRVRVNTLVTYPHLPALSGAGICDGFGDEWLKIGGIKAFADGAVAGRSCAVAEPFEGSDDFGTLTTDPAELRTLARSCADAGLTLAVHANGERAILMVLGALEHVGASGGPVPRVRIEHCSIITDDIIAKMAALHVSAVPFAGYPLYHGDSLLQWYGAGRAERMFAHRSFLDAGIPVAGSSDYPCGPLPPLAGIQSCVTRTSSGGHAFGRGQRISADEAIALYTRGSAALEHEQHRKGRLADGYLADFVVLEEDPRHAAPEDIAGIGVIATWVGGRRQWGKAPD
jgi:predicted amidohydrolase YtcJ